MMHMQQRLAWGMCLVVVFVGCQAAGPTGGDAVPMAIHEHHHGTDDALPGGDVLVINSRAELEASGSRDLINRDIDFRRVSLVIMSAGEMPTSGYEACIAGVQVRGSQLIVQGTVNGPAPDEVVAQVLTHPYCAVEIDKTRATSVHPEIE